MKDDLHCGFLPKEQNIGAPANVNFLAISEMEDVTLKLDHWVGEKLK